MNKEKKEKLINEIVGILHKDAGIMYDADFGGEQYVSLTEDYFEDVAESIYYRVEGVVIYPKKNHLERGFRSVVAVLVKEAIDNFNTKWTSHEEQINGINEIASSIAFAVNTHYTDRMGYLENEVNRLRLKEEELGNMLLKASSRLEDK